MWVLNISTMIHVHVYVTWKAIMIKPKTSGWTWIGKYHIYMYKLEKVGLNKKKFQSIAKEFEFRI